MHVLFCTDGSKISFNALHNFAKWTKGAIVDVICVIDWTFLPEEVSIEAEGFSSSCANVADNILDFAEKEICKTNLICGERIKCCGEAVSCILEQMDKEKYDIVLLGSHGKKGIQRWLGSVSRDIVNNSGISSYVSKYENRCKKILFATDGTDNSYKAVSQSIKYLNLNEKEIYICVVSENPDLLFLEGNLDSQWLLEIEQRQHRNAERIIKDVRSKLEEYSLPIEKDAIITGIPAEKIIDFAREESIDLVVTGTREKSKIRGSVSKRVLEITSADVFIVR